MTAVEQRASDIHFEPKREATLVRLRVMNDLRNEGLVTDKLRWAPAAEVPVRG